jgi:prophage tail gpP-like protein
VPDAPPPALAPGAACELRVGADPLIKGYVDAVEATIDGERYEVILRGRDKTGDLVDCSVIPPLSEWTNISLKDLATGLCAPFGIAVHDQVGAWRVPKFVLEPNETVYEALARAARVAGVLLISDGRGGLVITTEGTARAPTALIYGANILSARATLDHTNRHSLYRVSGQVAGSLREAPHNAVSLALDSGTGRYRPLGIAAEGGLTEGRYDERAEWEKRVRRARAAAVTITTVGWHHDPTGTEGLWTPNTRVHVEAGVLGIKQEMLLAGVALTLGESGTLAELTLYPPGSFSLIPLPEGDDGPKFWEEPRKPST